MWRQRAVRVVAFLVLLALALATGYAAGQDRVIAGVSSLPAILSASQDKPERVEIAEGEYTIFKEYGGVGPIESEIFNFHETWAMWRTSAGDYEVEGTRSFECPKDYPRDVRFWLHLSSDFQLIEAKEYTPLIWIPRSGPLACSFSQKTLQCSANGKDPGNNRDLSLSMDKPYAFSWPLSAFSVAALTRQADKRPGRITQVQLVEIAQPSPSNPVMPITGGGTLRYLGQDHVVAAGKNWSADKFELQARMPDVPHKSLLWVSGSGLLLKIEVQREIGPKGTLELTRFEDRTGSPLFR